MSTVIISRPRRVIRRSMVRTVEDLSNLDEITLNTDVSTICAKPVNDWTAEEEAAVQLAIDQVRLSDV